MKKIFLTALIISGFYCRGQAAILVLIFGEQLATETFHLSIDAGINVPTFIGVENPGSTKLGAHFGLGTHWNFAPKWQFVGEFTPLNGGGMKGLPYLSLPDSITQQLNDDDNSWVINTIDIPLMVRYSLTDRFHIGGGPIISFISSAEQQRVASVEGKELTLTEDIRDSFNTFQYGMAADVCYSLSTARKGKGIDLRLRYNYMFSSLLKEDIGNNVNLGTFQVIATFPFIL